MRAGTGAISHLALTGLGILRVVAFAQNAEIIENLK
jgi:hypothetical protein